MKAINTRGQRSDLDLFNAPVSMNVAGGELCLRCALQKQISENSGNE